MSKLFHPVWVFLVSILVAVLYLALAVGITYMPNEIRSDVEKGFPDFLKMQASGCLLREILIEQPISRSTNNHDQITVVVARPSDDEDGSIREKLNSALVNTGLQVKIINSCRHFNVDDFNVRPAAGVAAERELRAQNWLQRWRADLLVFLDGTSNQFDIDSSAPAPAFQIFLIENEQNFLLREVAMRSHDEVGNSTSLSTQVPPIDIKGTPANWSSDIEKGLSVILHGIIVSKAAFLEKEGIETSSVDISYLLSPLEEIALERVRIEGIQASNVRQIYRRLIIEQLDNHSNLGLAQQLLSFEQQAESLGSFDELVLAEISLGMATHTLGSWNRDLSLLEKSCSHFENALVGLGRIPVSSRSPDEEGEVFFRLGAAQSIYGRYVDRSEYLEKSLHNLDNAVSRFEIGTARRHNLAESLAFRSITRIFSHDQFEKSWNLELAKADMRKAIAIWKEISSPYKQALGEAALVIIEVADISKSFSQTVWSRASLAELGREVKKQKLILEKIHASSALNTGQYADRNAISLDTAIYQLDYIIMQSECYKGLYERKIGSCDDGALRTTISAMHDRVRKFLASDAGSEMPNAFRASLERSLGNQYKNEAFFWRRKAALVASFLSDKDNRFRPDDINTPDKSLLADYKNRWGDALTEASVWISEARDEMQSEEFYYPYDYEKTLVAFATIKFSLVEIADYELRFNLYPREKIITKKDEYRRLQLDAINFFNEALYIAETAGREGSVYKICSSLKAIETLTSSINELEDNFLSEDILSDSSKAARCNSNGTTLVSENDNNAAHSIGTDISRYAYNDIDRNTLDLTNEPTGIELSTSYAGSVGFDDGYPSFAEPSYAIMPVEQMPIIFLPAVHYK